MEELQEGMGALPMEPQELVHTQRSAFLGWRAYLPSLWDPYPPQVPNTHARTLARARAHRIRDDRLSAILTGALQYAELRYVVVIRNPCRRPELKHDSWH
jgi:hypothetical protein